ncbi:aminoglycoside phosphotransferase family protein [Nocardia sp. NPDC024068]|uniref:phosphotransferase family protein n=1 Tax=Nocardia sp. NPDC024068 TaxID=3157197 RepID=UPI0033F55A20
METRASDSAWAVPVPRRDPTGPTPAPPPEDIRDLRRDLLRRLLPAEPDTVVCRGQFYEVIVGADRVVCLPRTPAAAGRLPRRARTLRMLAELDLGVRAPVPLAAGRDADATPYLVLDRIPGAPLDPAALSGSETASRVADQYAALLTALARAGQDAVVRRRLPRTPVDRWPRFAREVRTDLFPLMSDRGRRRAGRELTALAAVPPLDDAVVHGDLGSENVLWAWADGVPRLTGVLDWDDIALGDPAEDLAAIEAGHGCAFVHGILTRHGPVDPGLGTRIAAVRGTFALQQALAGLRDGDPAEMAEGLAEYR